MAEVRSSAGVPAVSAFGGLGAPSPGTPLVVDTTQGNLYTLIGGAVVQSASSGGATGLLFGVGVPASGLGVNGNFYFRSDGVAGSNVYKKTTGTWGAIL